MKNTTLNTLNTAAKIISNDMLKALASGQIRASEDNSSDEFKNIKETIRHMNSHFTNITNHSMTNVVKTTQQFNYLTNEVLTRLRRAKFFSSDKIIHDGHKQLEFNF